MYYIDGYWVHVSRCQENYNKNKLLKDDLEL